MVIKVIRWFFLVIFIIFILITFFSASNNKNKTLKLYWFIPDGTRNDSKVFDIYKLASEGYLPNIKTMMDKGSYGYSIPDFPSHTPTNFATLLTGSHPDTHGISDGSIHIEGYPLNIVPIGGFRSNAKNVSPAWTLFEQSGLHAFLLSIPGSTPPELSTGETVRGRWGGWGADFYAVNFQDSKTNRFADQTSKNNLLFNNGPRLTEFISSKIVERYPVDIKSFSPVKQIDLDTWGSKIEGYIYDSTDDNNINYDKIGFSFNKKTVICNLKQGDWSAWIPITLQWRTRDDFNLYTPQKTTFEKDYATLDIPTYVKIKLIMLDGDGTFSVRLLFNVLNSTLTAPASVANDLLKNIGPMVDFPDNYPPQLIYRNEDKNTFLEEANMSLEWHKKAVSQIIKTYSPQIVIQDAYTPNQMLTSRWWMRYVDPKSESYNDITEINRMLLWNEVREMYKKLDDIIGEIIKNSSKDTIVVFSSDHGVAALNKEIYLNNLFAREGLLKIIFNKEKNIYDIDFNESKVIFLQSTNIYINPKGLGGNWSRASGSEYKDLRNRVMDILNNLKDEKGFTPLAKIATWENAQKEFGIPTKQSGDLVIANKIGYSWVEDVTNDGILIKTPLKSGYKQGILSQNEPDLWSSFMIMGPGIKQGFKLTKPISNADQLPTILKLLRINIPAYMQGKVIKEILF